MMYKESFKPDNVMMKLVYVICEQHLHSMISIFVIHIWYDSYRFYINNFKTLASFCSKQAGLSLPWGDTCDDRFSHDMPISCFSSVRDLRNIVMKASW